MMNNSIFAALFLLPVLLSVVCQAESSTRHFVVDFQQDDAGSPIQGFSVKCDFNTLSYTSTDMVDTNGYAGLDIESISWPLIYATHLLATYEPILSIHDTPLSGKPLSWLPAGAFVALGWLLKNYWNSDPSLLIAMDQLEASQDDRFAIITMMLPGNGQQKNDQQNPPSTSSGQQATGGATSTRITGYASGSPPGGSDGDDRNPESQQHTFGYNCHFGSCHGICKLRSPNHPTMATFGTRSYSLPEIAYEELLRQEQLRPDILARPGAASRSTAGDPDPTGRFVCDVQMETWNGERAPCGMSCSNRERLSEHKMRYHTAPLFCDVVVVGGDGEQQLCGQVLHLPQQEDHNSRYHDDEMDIRWSDPNRSHQVPGSVFCDVVVYVNVNEGRLNRMTQQLCGRIFESEEGLLRHIGRHHQGFHRRWRDIRLPADLRWRF
ncbi:hypothetical protein [Endozoicomonas sp. 8E]|uniref:hypothetical protein n=1 Tax=Endozoicomonas sp. 8E TaxID=3035692 RepID=UPI0029390C6C|nr:hypothetical protein [Endozoicomonas sp. 8E]WOG28306.1 hypothetical protein P6910_01250 [Endozoicomonas sp. 8E]